MSARDPRLDPGRGSNAADREADEEEEEQRRRREPQGDGSDARLDPGSGSNPAERDGDGSEEDDGQERDEQASDVEPSRGAVDDRPSDGRIDGPSSERPDPTGAERLDRRDDPVLSRSSGPERIDNPAIRDQVARQVEDVDASDIRVVEDRRRVPSDRVAPTQGDGERTVQRVELTDRALREQAADQSDRFEPDDLVVEDGEVQVRDSAIGAGGQIDFSAREEAGVEPANFREPAPDRDIGQAIMGAGADIGGAVGGLGGETGETFGRSFGGTVGAIPAAPFTLTAEARQASDFVTGDAVDLAQRDINEGAAAREAVALLDEDEEDARDRSLQLAAGAVDETIRPIDQSIDFSLSGLEVRDRPILPVLPTDVARAATTFEADDEFRARRSGALLGTAATVPVTAGIGRGAGSAARLARRTGSRRPGSGAARQLGVDDFVSDTRAQTGGSRGAFRDRDSRRGGDDAPTGTPGRGVSRDRLRDRNDQISLESERGMARGRSDADESFAGPVDRNQMIGREAADDSPAVVREDVSDLPGRGELGRLEATRTEALSGVGPVQSRLFGDQDTASSLGLRFEQRLGESARSVQEEDLQTGTVSGQEQFLEPTQDRLLGEDQAIAQEPTTRSETDTRQRSRTRSRTATRSAQRQTSSEQARTRSRARSRSPSRFRTGRFTAQSGGTPRPRRPRFPEPDPVEGADPLDFEPEASDRAPVREEAPLAVGFGTETFQAFALGGFGDRSLAQDVEEPSITGELPTATVADPDDEEAPLLENVSQFFFGGADTDQERSDGAFFGGGQG